jgi:hypothetical protein
LLKLRQHAARMSIAGRKIDGQIERRRKRPA